MVSVASLGLNQALVMGITRDRIYGLIYGIHKVEKLACLLE